MRALFLIALLAVTTALANPRVANPGLGGPALVGAYLHSEHLLVSVSATEAVFRGSFTFATAHEWRGDSRLFVSLYIWLPEDSAGDPAVEAFWKALGRDDLATTNGVHLQALQRAVGLTVRVGDRELKPGKGIDSFSLKHYRPSVTLVLGPDQEKVEAIFRQRYPTYRKPEPEEMDEPEFCLVGVTFVESGTVLTNQTLTVNYRQPLARCTEGGRFFYMPIFTGVPEDISTTDTNQYSISFAARGCFLTITNGTQEATVASGQSMTFGPQRHQPFRATATAGPNLLTGGLIRAGAANQAPEPSYQGQSLYEWLAYYDATDQSFPVRERSTAFQRAAWQEALKKAAAAVLQMGTNAIPCLLAWIESNTNYHSAGGTAYRARLAVAGFCILGAEARSACPQLARLARDSRQKGVAESAVEGLVNIGPTGLPEMISILTDTSALGREKVAEAIGGFGTNGLPALPAYFDASATRICSLPSPQQLR